MIQSSDGRRQDDDPAVSDLIGFILVFSLVMVVVAIVSLAGMSSLEATRTAEQTNNAERAMEVLADNMADIHERGAPSRATEIALDGDSMSLGEETLVVVRGRDTASGSTFLTSRVFQIRPIVYDTGDTRLVYEMGAVFREDARGGTVVVPYSPTLGDDRALVPVINTGSSTGGSQHLQSSTVLVRGTANTRAVPVADTDPGVTYDETYINVSSPRQELWNRTLSANRGLDCSQEGADWVNCTLRDDPNHLVVTETRIAVEIAE